MDNFVFPTDQRGSSGHWAIDDSTIRTGGLSKLRKLVRDDSPRREYRVSGARHQT